METIPEEGTPFEETFRSRANSQTAHLPDSSGGATTTAQTSNFMPQQQQQLGEISKRKLANASLAEQRYRKAVLSAAAELSHEFSEHYWAMINAQNSSTMEGVQSQSNTSVETIKKGFIFYLNASGKYLILREHLRGAISTLVQQKCLNMRPSGFHNHRDFQAYLHDMYVYLVDEMHEIINASSLQETDPLKSNFDRLLQQTNCGEDQDLTKASLHQRQITDLGLFAEEAFAQGDFEGCHKLHLQRICKDRESARTWTEFAILWLSKGDDRMAEIAVREALHKDPLYLYALIISGILAVRHGDKGGLDCLGSALQQRPMSPELLVINGMANNLLQNEEAAGEFFQKAAYVRRAIGGQSVKDLETLFQEKGQFDMKDMVNGMDTESSSVKPSSGESEETNQTHSAGTGSGDHLPTSPEHGEMAAAAETHGHAAGDKEAERKKSLNDSVHHHEAEHEIPVKKRHSKKGKGKDPLHGAISNENKPAAEAGETKKKKRSSAALKQQKSMRRKSSTHANDGALDEALAATPNANSQHEMEVSKPAYQVDVKDIHEDEFILPLLTPSILSSWDVTEFSEKMLQHLQTVDFLESAEPSNPNEVLQAGPSLHNVISNDTGVASDTQIKTAYSKILHRKSSSQGVAASNSSSSRKKKSDANSDGRESLKTEDDVHSHQDGNKLSDRLGSELIWAAKLLMSLRLFDFVDGILARQLHFYGKRTLQFIYLRALSLYMRQREEEALRMIKEAIEIDNSNAKFYTLEGHCYYTLGNAQEAINSYEKALKLPHSNENRHLLYLRYGSLILNNSNTKLAKRVFLHGVSKYPTPYMWLALGNTCFQRKEYDQAESSFSEANRLDSVNAITWGHLVLSSLMQNKKTLAEQAYKWAIRFGLKKGSPLLDEIHKLQREKGFGDPSFPRVPNCVPHEYFLRRMGKTKPFNIYREGLNQERPRMGKERFADTDNEELMKRKLEHKAGQHQQRRSIPHEEEWEGEGSLFLDLDPLGAYQQQQSPQPQDNQQSGSRRNTPNANATAAGYLDGDYPPDLVTIKNPPPPQQDEQAQNNPSLPPLRKSQ